MDWKLRQLGWWSVLYRHWLTSPYSKADGLHVYMYLHSLEAVLPQGQAWLPISLLALLIPHVGLSSPALPVLYHQEADLG